MNFLSRLRNRICSKEIIKDIGDVVAFGKYHLDGVNRICSIENIKDIGDVVAFGKYHQDGVNRTPVEWIVLDINDGNALLISKYALITSGYCQYPLTNYRQLEWKNSLAREKCRSFFDECFSQAEQEIITEKKIEMNGFGQDCFDRVFFLSEAEVNRYLPLIEDRKCKPTPEAQKTGARMGWTNDTKEYTSWWILPECIRKGGRTKLYNSNEEYDGTIYPKAVFQTGEMQYHGRNVCHLDFCIRPSILVKLQD